MHFSITTNSPITAIKITITKFYTKTKVIINPQNKQIMKKILLFLAISLTFISCTVDESASAEKFAEDQVALKYSVTFNNFESPITSIHIQELSSSGDVLLFKEYEKVTSIKYNMTLGSKLKVYIYDDATYGGNDNFHLFYTIRYTQQGIPNFEGDIPGKHIKIYDIDPENPY